MDKLFREGAFKKTKKIITFHPVALKQKAFNLGNPLGKIYQKPT